MPAGSVAGTGLAEHAEHAGSVAGPAPLCRRFHPLCSIPPKGCFLQGVVFHMVTAYQVDLRLFFQKSAVSWKLDV